MSNELVDQLSPISKASLADADEKRSVFRSWRRSLSAKIVTFAFALIAFTVLVVTAASVIQVRSSIEESFSSSAVNKSKLLAESVADALKDRDMQLTADPLSRAADTPKMHLEGFAALHVNSGELEVSDEIARGMLASRVSRYLDGTQRNPMVEVTPDGRHLVVIDVAGVDNEGRPTGVLGTAWSRAHIENQISDLWTNGLRTGLLMFVILGATLYVLLPRFLARPLIHAARSLTKLAHGDTSFEVADLKRGDEVGGIARAIQLLKIAKNEQDTQIAVVRPEQPSDLKASA